MTSTPTTLKWTGVATLLSVFCWLVTWDLGWTPGSLCTFSLPDSGIYKSQILWLYFFCVICIKTALSIEPIAGFPFPQKWDMDAKGATCESRVSGCTFIQHAIICIFLALCTRGGLPNTMRSHKNPDTLADAGYSMQNVYFEPFPDADPGDWCINRCITILHGRCYRNYDWIYKTPKQSHSPLMKELKEALEKWVWRLFPHCYHLGNKLWKQMAVMLQPRPVKAKSLEVGPQHW